jgi:hypothetical protein
MSERRNFLANRHCAEVKLPDAKAADNVGCEHPSPPL